MTTRRIGPFSVTPIGLGCMSLSHAYGAPSAPEDGAKLLLRAFDDVETLASSIRSKLILEIAGEPAAGEADHAALANSAAGGGR